VFASVQTRRGMQKHEVRSNPVHVEVFSQLDVKPGKLLLLPEGSYTLRLSGGPSLSGTTPGRGLAGHLGGSITRTFVSLDPTIATVHPYYGEVLAHTVGRTLIQVTITQEVRDRTGNVRYQELCKKEVPISVRLATNVEIVGIQPRSQLSGSTVRLLALLKHYNETFTFGVFPVDYIWSSRQHHIVSLHPYRTGMRSSASEGKDATTPASTIQSDQPGIEAVAQKSGDAEVCVYVTIQYPELYEHERREFNVSGIIRVLEPLYGEVQTFIGSPLIPTVTYLLPPNSVHKLATNKEGKMVLYSIRHVE
jgi:hypothetical protein